MKVEKENKMMQNLGFLEIFNKIFVKIFVKSKKRPTLIVWSILLLRIFWLCGQLQTTCNRCDPLIIKLSCNLHSYRINF